MKKIALFLLLACLGFSKTTFAQTAEEEAEVYFENAEKAYDNKDYIACESALVKCVQKLCNTNTKIDYLRIRNMYDEISNAPGGDGYGNYLLLRNTIADFFKKVNKATYPEEKYKEIISIKLAISDKLDFYDNQKAIYANYKKREPRFLTDTVDVYMRQFVDEYNKAWDNLVGSCRKKDFASGKVAYDSIKRFIYYVSNQPGGFDYKNLMLSQVQGLYVISNYSPSGIKLVSDVSQSSRPSHSFFPPHRPPADPRHRTAEDAPCTIAVSNIITDLVAKLKESGFDAYYRGDYKDIMAE